MWLRGIYTWWGGGIGGEVTLIYEEGSAGVGSGMRHVGHHSHGVNMHGGGDSLRACTSPG